MMENEIFYCESIASCKDNLMLIKGYKTAKKTGYGLERYLKEFAYEDEKEHMANTYLVKDKTSNELVGYFSVKAGMVSTSERRNGLFTSFDAVPGIELANFGVNGEYKRNHNESVGIGKIIFIDFILPICQAAANIIGAKILYIFALPYDELIRYYNSLNFQRLSKKEEFQVHRRIRPRYDTACIFMYRSIHGK